MSHHTRKRSKQSSSKSEQLDYTPSLASVSEETLPRKEPAPPKISCPGSKTTEIFPGTRNHAEQLMTILHGIHHHPNKNPATSLATFYLPQFDAEFRREICNGITILADTICSNYSDCFLPVAEPVAPPTPPANLDVDCSVDTDVRSSSEASVATDPIPSEPLVPRPTPSYAPTAPPTPRACESRPKGTATPFSPPAKSSRPSKSHLCKIRQSS